ncbi:MAG: nucleoside monophosphate kinase [Actinobacteria bacterium]|nr:nucleoside monophosphate kinase [Actinomycetota bacterium]
MKRVVLMGPPASGKGTQGPWLAEAMGVPHLSSGYLLRRSIEEGDPHGVAGLVSAGEKVPDPVVEAVLEPRLGEGFVLDGYPRSVEQARRLDELLARYGMDLDVAVELAVDPRTLTERMELRSATEGRIDDTPEVFLRRLAEYEADAPALRAHYEGRLVVVDALGTPEDVFTRLRAALDL